MKSQKFNVVSAQSNIEWVGRKVTGAHNGTISIKEGTLTLNDGNITDGKFIIDTTSIKILDIEDANTNAQMSGHLASDDFFASEKFPEAVFEITHVNNPHIAGNLIIKNITHPVSFDATVLVSDDVLTASGKIVIDRTKYEMKFRSGSFFQNLGDTLIYNDFDLTINITAKAATVAVLA